MTLARVVHVRDPHDLYIGRLSQWGNPFVVGRDGERDDVIAKHRRWVMRQPHLMAQIPSLIGLRLACHCAPRTCHGDILAKMANELADMLG